MKVHLNIDYPTIISMSGEPEYGRQYPVELPEEQVAAYKKIFADFWAMQVVLEKLEDQAYRKHVESLLCASEKSATSTT